MQKYRLYLTRLQKDDLKTSSSGVLKQHSDILPRDAAAAGDRSSESITMQPNEAVNRPPINSRIHEVDSKGGTAVSLQTIIKPKKNLVLTGYAAAGSNIAFGSTQEYSALLPNDYSWNGGIQFKQEHNAQFQVQNGFRLPTQQVQQSVACGPFTKERDDKPDNPTSYSMLYQNLMPSFQPPDPVNSLEQTSINNLELSAFLLQGQHCSYSTNLDMQNDPDLITEVPSHVYDALRFDDYEYPPDYSLEYPVIDQGLFIV